MEIKIGTPEQTLNKIVETMRTEFGIHLNSDDFGFIKENSYYAYCSEDYVMISHNSVNDGTQDIRVLTATDFCSFLWRISLKNFELVYAYRADMDEEVERTYCFEYDELGGVEDE